MKFLWFIYVILFLTSSIFSQNSVIYGKVTSNNKGVSYVKIIIENTSYLTLTNEEGLYTLSGIKPGKYKIIAKHYEYDDAYKWIEIKTNDTIKVNINLIEKLNNLNEVVVTGTLKEVEKSESPVSVEVYNESYFKKNPTPNIFDALQNVNGVRPQLNCQICNTGDIHINGLEGPYTMVLIDGMPIVGALASVYGLSGIPNSIIQRIEIIKGPASSLYGSEAVGGVINVITKNPTNAALLSLNIFGTSWAEFNADISLKTKLSRNISVLTGVNYFNYNLPIDKNHDNFTDMTLQNRVSVFQKWNFKQKNNKLFTLANRYLYEDRWGGEMNWNKHFRGSDSIYGESIYTSRWELTGAYQLPLKEKLLITFSYNDHQQNSVYGNTPFIANQKIAFSQLTWDKNYNAHSILVGSALRFTFYDDNTYATETNEHTNLPSKTWLPGVFVQDNIKLNNKNKLLFGLRYDYNSNHGNIITPRVAYKWSFNQKNIFRINAGTGYRVVNIFTEDHAALTGARTVIIKEKLNPEQSYNVNLNYIKKIFTKNETIFNIDLSAFYTYFKNRIVADYLTDPNKIFYDNLMGYAVSKGLTLNLKTIFPFGLKIISGCTLMKNTLNENGITSQQLLTENFSGTWTASYTIKKISVDYTGNIYSPMKLPLLSELDPRSEKSPWWSIQNIQLKYHHSKRFEIYGGIKNFLNWTPNKGNPFLIARANDPFDKKVLFDQNGTAKVTPENPYGLTFDPTYIYAPNQGIRFFIGLNFKID